MAGDGKDELSKVQRPEVKKRRGGARFVGSASPPVIVALQEDAQGLHLVIAHN